jgi:Uncharacterised nucleotidyltransferase
MQLTKSDLPAHARLLLECLAEPRRARSLRETEWDILIRSARSARLLGVLSARIGRLTPAGALPERVSRQLLAGTIEARFRRQKAMYLLRAIESQLCVEGSTPVLLKGAAYIAQGLAMAEGRLPADVDVMVPRLALGAVERALLDAGWEFEKTDPYDQHYYRAWSHELPPMKCAGQALELDVHHGVLPPLGRLKPNTEALFAATIPVEGTPFRVLSPPDQVLHAAAHLFQDSDCTGRLRDLVDIDGLVRCFAERDASFWLGRPLWYALTFGRDWLATPVPVGVLKSDRRAEPPVLARWLVKTLVPLSLFPVAPDSVGSAKNRIASRVMEARAFWLRMPPWLVLFHSINKYFLGLLRKPAA